MRSINSRESNFSQFVAEHLEPFWQAQAQPGFFVNAQGLDIHYVRVTCESPRATIVISPGRVEGYLKYKELAYDFVQLGYQVFIIDHQGQGLSSRRLANRHKGYVSDFNDYVIDLALFVDDIVKPQMIGKLHLVCHSMGGAIGLRFIQQFPDVFHSALFSSPMWGFISGNVPQKLARKVVKTGNKLSDTFGRDSAYFFGGKDYYRKPFVNNELTNSQSRYEYFRDVYDQHPELQLGGITYGWLQASIDALDIAQAELDKVSIPLMVLQAEHDPVVDNAAQTLFCQKLSMLNAKQYAGILNVIPGCLHEIFIESDDKRRVALDLIVKFLQEQDKTPIE